MTTPAVDLSGLKIDDRARGRGPRAARRSRWLWGGLALVALALVALALLRGGTKDVQVVAVRAADGRPPALLQASGYVTPRRRATVAAKITGRVVHVDAEEGTPVAAGHVLARLDDAEARRRVDASLAEQKVAGAQLADLEVNLRLAQVEERRAQKLRDEGVGSDQALDAARTQAESLAARLALAREQVRASGSAVAITRQDLDNCTVRAPFAGIVVSKDAQVGEMVSPISAGGGFTRTGIATIVDMASLEVEVDVNESFIARVVPGQRVEAILDAYPEWKIPARVRTVIPTADRQKATVKVRIAFDALDPKILPDMGVKVAFLGEAEDAVPAGRALVPKTAVGEADGAAFVFLVEDGKARRREVRAGAEHGADREVLSGLAPGEKVVANAAGLAEGDRVAVPEA